MSFKVRTTDEFDRAVRRLVKKYSSTKSDIAALASKLSENPTIGTSLGGNIYKIRLGIKSTGKGKSGGARVYTYVFIEGTTVYLTDIRMKSETDNVTDDWIAVLRATAIKQIEEGPD